MATWTKITKPTSTAWVKVQPSGGIPSGTPIGLLLSITYAANQFTTSWTKITKASGTSWTKITKAS